MSIVSRRFLLQSGLSALALAGGVAAIAPMAHAQGIGIIIVPAEPPRTRYEYIPPPPYHRREVLVWDPGHWHWDGRGWVWIAGHYVERPRHEAIWVPGHWASYPDGWHWTPGGWH